MDHRRENPDRPHPQWRLPGTASLTVGLVLALVTGACTGNDGSAIPEGASSASPPGGARAKTIPQPLVTNIPVASDSARIDIAMPTFSTPTNVTNPLFPISLQESVLLLGTVDGGAFRTEVACCPRRGSSSGAARGWRR